MRKKSGLSVYTNGKNTAVDERQRKFSAFTQGIKAHDRPNV
jgi:hypothetical protein